MKPNGRVDKLFEIGMTKWFHVLVRSLREREREYFMLACTKGVGSRGY
jgi:hypothetical protein